MPNDAQALPGPDRFRAARTYHAWSKRHQDAVLVARDGRIALVRSRVMAPLRAARESLRAVRTHGAAAHASSGVGLATQFARCWWLLMQHRITPTYFYQFAVYRDDRWPMGAYFGQWWEARMLYRIAARYVDQDAFLTLGSKHRFETWCLNEGIPTAENVAVYDAGARIDTTDPAASLPPVQLFVKWANLFGGDQTLRADWEGDRYRCSDGPDRTVAELYEYLIERSTRGQVLVQRLLRNDPALRVFGQALSTLRIMTARIGDGQPIPIVAIMRMGTGGSTADNSSQGGIAANIDLDTGVAGPACRVHRQREFHTHHPDTNVPIQGFVVPQWEAARALAVRAHERMGTLPCVGWDVAITDDGPILIEGNWGPCTDLAQIPANIPLLATLYGSAFVAALDGVMRKISDAELMAVAAYRPETGGVDE